MGSSKSGRGSAAVTVTNIHDPEQFKALSVRLLAFARRFARTLTWWMGGSDALARGNTIEDVVVEALASLYGGKGRWDPAKYPDPFLFLRLVVGTKLRNLSVSSENKHSEREVADDIIITAESPLDLLIEAEDAAARAKVFATAYPLLIDQLDGDPHLQRLHDLIMYEDVHKPQRLAECMGMSVADVNKLKKRFWRACERVSVLLGEGTN